MLAAKEVERPHIAPGMLHGDCILEVNWNGDTVWEWQSVDHFDEMDFSEEAKNAIYRGGRVGADPYDWVHSNSVSYLGPNKWYDAGDERFHPDNFIWDGRHTNTIAVISKKTDKIAWKVGARLFTDIRTAGTGLDHWAASRTHDTKRLARCRKYPGIRQWRCCWIWRTESGCSQREDERGTRLFSCGRIRSNNTGSCVGVFRAQGGWRPGPRLSFLQPPVEFCTALAQWQYTDLRRGGRSTF